MKNLIALTLALALAGCATCEQHKVACSVAGALVVGSVAATIAAQHQGPQAAHAGTVCAPYCAVSTAR